MNIDDFEKLVKKNEISNSESNTILVVEYNKNIYILVFVDVGKNKTGNKITELLVFLNSKNITNKIDFKTGTPKKNRNCIKFYTLDLKKIQEDVYNYIINNF